MSEPDLNFPQLIRHGRREKHLTQRAAASEFGVDYTYISKLETGACPFPPSDELIGKMADCYGIPADMLFVAAGKCPPDLLDRMKTSLTFVNRVRELAEDRS
jgi:transcriptional regulator with XRE-family HTH domain